MLACKNESGSQPVSSPVVFFDLKSLVEKDIRQLSNAGCGIYKVVDIDGKKEEHPSIKADFQKELQPLLDADINKAAWIDQFTEDSVEAGGEKILQYNTMSDKINIKSMQVFLVNGTVKKIAIRKSIRSFAFSFDSQINYFPGKGYDIHTEQKAFLIPKFVMEVQASFTCK